MTPSNSAVRRLERSLRRRIGLNQRMRRAMESIPAALQITIAAVVAYLVAHFLLEHAYPVFAVTVTISALGFSRDARPLRVVESILGILFGIGLSEVLVAVVGTGALQLGFVLVVVLLVCRFVSPSTGFAVAAGVQSMLVIVLPAPAGGVFVRSLDGLVGGVIALLVTALIPRDPRRACRRDSRNFFSVVGEALDGVVQALEHGDEPAAELALGRLRRTQPILDDWTQSLDAAIAIARISPFLRRHLPELRADLPLLAGLDLAVRHLRIITRRVDFLVRDDHRYPELAALVAELAAGIRLLSTNRTLARTRLAELAEKLNPETVLTRPELTESVLVMLLRPLLVDLLSAGGVAPEQARGHLPPV
ncbi:MAG: FUSC family protein [Microbacteriaceae bacterium]|nr:FUSC family protein [Microbacteriaceae bacterium]